MFTELQCPHIQRSVLAVEQVLVPVKCLHGNRVHRHSILQHGFTIFAKLQFSHPVDEPFPGIFLGNRQGKHIQLVCQQLRQLRNLKISFVRSPDRTVIDVPALAFTVIPGDLLKIVRKHIAHADLIPTIPGIRVWSHFLQCDCDFREIRLEFDVVLLIQLGEFFIHNVLRIDRRVYRSAGIHRIPNRDCSIGRAGLLAVPLVTHQSRSAEDAVHLLFIAATPECQDRQHCHVCIRLAAIEFFPLTGMQLLELLAVAGLLCVSNDCLIIQIRVMLEMVLLYLLVSLHQRIQQCRHRSLVIRNLTCAVNISRHGDEAVCRTGHIHFQMLAAVVDVIDRLVKDIILCHMEESTQTFSGR